MIQEKQSAECLILNGSCHIVVSCEIGKEVADLRLSHINWMALVVKKDEAPYPIEVGAFSSEAEVFKSSDIANIV
jgi:hypothetical protein